MDNNPKNQIVDKLKEANNVLVTVSTNPSVDQLAGAIGLTLLLSKLKKHATTVFSGQIPSTIEFLKPEETIETTTNSLRDFIIALDKGKADKIRYKVEDTMVKIFITPYRTSINDQDLVFSQGDFNVDVVIALGVHNKDDVDQAITAHGRILHDATVATVNTKETSEVGSLNWVDPAASSLCEMLVVLGEQLKANSLDNQMATAFLTGIVSETERFSNAKTTSNTMNASAKLMAAGANQQLVATKLQEPAKPPENKPPKDDGTASGGGEAPEEKEASVADDGSLHINHEAEEEAKPPQHAEPVPPQPAEESHLEAVLPEPVEPPRPVEQIHINEDGQLQPPLPQQPPHEPPHIVHESRDFLDEPPMSQREEDKFGGSVDMASGRPTDNTNLIMQPPAFGGQLSATSDHFDQDSALSLPAVNAPILSHGNSASADQPKYEPPAPPPPPSPAPPESPPLTPDQIFQTSTPAPLAPPPMAPSLPQAAPPPIPDLPAPAEPPASDHSDSKLPQSVISVMDDQTLGQIEKAVDSPHRKQVAASFEDKTLGDIEKAVDGHHTDIAAQAARAMSDKTLNTLEEKVQSPHLQYEAIASEPPEKSAPVKPVSSESPLDTLVPAEPPKEEIPAPVPTEVPGPATPSAPEPVAADGASTSTLGAALPPELANDPYTSQIQATAPPSDAKDEDSPSQNTDAARNAVTDAINAASGGDPLAALGGSGANDPASAGHDDPASAAPSTPGPESQTPSANIHIDQEGTLSFPQNLVPPSDGLPPDATQTQVTDPSAPPPVPPPMMPPLPSPVDNGQAPS